MSHYTVLVVGDDYEQALEPFDENIVMPQYIAHTKADLIANQRQNIAQYRDGLYAQYLADPAVYLAGCSNPDHIRYLQEEFPQRLTWTDEQCYAEAIRYVEPENIDADGGELSTYNPRSKHDWYVLGGRWDGGLTTTDNRQVNQCRKGDLHLEATPAPFAFLRDGQWAERGEMGWWGSVRDEQEDWEQTVARLIAEVPDDALLSLVDLHI